MEIQFNLRFFTFSIILLFLSSSCSKDIGVGRELSEEPPNPFVRLGEYQGTEISASEEASFIMHIKTRENRDDQFIISNFANLRAEIFAYGADEGLQIPEQHFGTGEGNYHIILHGKIVQTSDHTLQIIYSVRHGIQQETYSIKGVYIGKCR